MTDTVIAIVGPSLDNIPNENIYSKLDNAVWAIVVDWSQNVKFISGGASGVDALCHKHALHENHPFDNSKYMPTHNHWQCGMSDCYGFKARNIKLAEDATKVYCVTYNIEDIENRTVCYHCLKRLDSKLVTHQASGGCWTLNYAEDLGKDIELVEV